ncbi:hypothetical protein VTO73DRAFT_4170 [Trametes versicolor]
MLPSLRSICALLALVALADAHGYVRTLAIDGKSYKGNLPREQQPAPVDSPIWQIATTSPVTSTTDPDLACGLGAQPAALTVPAGPGSNISINWASTKPPPSYWFHNVGPIMIYIASCEGTPCAQFDRSAAKWAKIAQAGQKAQFSKDWVQGDLSEHLCLFYISIFLHAEHADPATGQPYSFSLPDNIKSGEYLLRPEIIALQGAMSGNAEFYVTCIQLNITGNGNGVPNATVSLPGAYNPDDAGINVDVYSTSDLDYVFPGGPIAAFVNDDGGIDDGASETQSSSQYSASQPSPSSASNAAPAMTTEATAAISTTATSDTANSGVTSLQATTAPTAVTSETPTASTTGTAASEQAATTTGGCTCGGATTTTAIAAATTVASESSVACDDVSETSTPGSATPSAVATKRRRHVFTPLVRQRMRGHI